ncbi:hypothetical protein GCM10010336_44740 [Streptomyces goshikiensis]|nr:hypothetical protein GCM10010336_44740 [Streptomyces goshikiensis]
MSAARATSRPAPRRAVTAVLRGAGAAASAAPLPAVARVSTDNTAPLGDLWFAKR